jgi:hypothetical protein
MNTAVTASATGVMTRAPAFTESGVLNIVCPFHFILPGPSRVVLQ